MLTWNTPHTELTLVHKDLLRLTGHSHTVICHSGSVWITQDDDSRDIVLDAGQRFTTARTRAALLYALAPARVTIRRHCPQPAAAPRTRIERPALMAAALQRVAQ